MSSVLHTLVYLTVSPQLNILYETLITLTLWGGREHAKVWSVNKLLTHDNSDINFHILKWKGTELCLVFTEQVRRPDNGHT